MNEKRASGRFAVIAFPNERRAVVDVDFANDWETCAKHLRHRFMEGRSVELYERKILTVRPKDHDGFPWENLL